MGGLSSGNETVDAMGEINITGNVIPLSWHKTIVRENGKPYLLAITLLADIVYWYRPVEVRDEATGNIIGWRKKFRSDYLQKTYEQYSEFYGESKRSIKSALDRLEEIGVIKKILRHVSLANGTTVPNVMYIALNAERLKQITFLSEPGDGTFGPVVQKLMEEEIDNTCDEIVKAPESPKTVDSVGYGTKFCRIPPSDQDDISQKNALYTANKRTPIIQNNVGYLSLNDRTNTENTKGSTNGEYQSIHLTFKESGKTSAPGSDEMDKMADKAGKLRDLIHRNTNFDWHMENDDIVDREEFAGLVELICDVVCAEHSKPIYVNSSAMPPEVVKSRLLKVNDEHIRYVMDCLRNNPNIDGIESLRNYKLTCLYNAPVTMDTYYQQMVNHDMGNSCHKTEGAAG